MLFAVTVQAVIGLFAIGAVLFVHIALYGPEGFALSASMCDTHRSANRNRFNKA